MSKKLMPQEHASKIQREAEDVAAVIKMPGWSVIAEDIKAQMEQIQQQLVENRLRTVHETVTTKEGSSTYITTAETQIAESAGSYKMGKYLFDLIDKVITGPTELARMEEQGVISIEHKEQATKGGETHE